jgi:S-formylglutathione hydrolase
MEQTQAWKMFDGVQHVYKHASSSTQTDMTFGIYLPPQARSGKVPVVVYLSGLTCTWENVSTKAGAQAHCAEMGLAFVAPDTSPRGDGVADDASYDMGQGAGFYLDALKSPWAPHFKMYSYITAELPALLRTQFPALDMDRVAIMGHSMGGHGALTLALKNPDAYKSVSAFAPIVSPMNCPWGEKALTGYLGEDRTSWRAYDTCALLEDGARLPEFLVDQGMADTFLVNQLKPELLEAACAKASQPLILRRQDGYDHSYYFMATFMRDHLVWHKQRLG